MKTLWDSLVRTYVPWLVGVILGWLVALGVPLDPEVETALTLVIITATSIIYYAAARWLETHVAPRFGVLLGSTKQPDYYKRIKVTEHGETFQVREDDTLA